MEASGVGTIRGEFGVTISLGVMIGGRRGVMVGGRRWAVPWGVGSGMIRARSGVMVRPGCGMMRDVRSEGLG